jgi:acetyl-CoA C-acetyltransferase
VVAELWAGFNRVAQGNPDAWNPAPMSADEIATTTPKNRLIAYPYNKWHVSQQNVDQASALVFCSVARAEALGVPRDRWVFPHAIVDSNHMVPISERAVLHRSPGFATAGARAFALAGVGVDDIAHVDLYSCFPIAVRTQALELGLGTDRALTVTGGMPFCGGPLNNYVVQSTATMMRVLRADPASLGLVTAISGMITKQGVTIWSTEPPVGGYRYDDVTASVVPLVAVVPVVDGVDERGIVSTYTVKGDAEGPARSIALVDIGGDRRALVVSDDRAVAAHLVANDAVGAAVQVHADDTFTLV